MAKLTLCFCSFRAENYCLVKPSLYPELILVADKYLENGQTMEFECVPQFGRLTDHFSKVTCTDNELSFRSCKYHFIIAHFPYQQHFYSLFLFSGCSWLTPDVSVTLESTFNTHTEFETQLLVLIQSNKIFTSAL